MSSRLPNFISALLGGLVVAVVFGALALGGVFDGDDEPRDVQPAATTVPTSAAPTAAPARSATDVSALFQRVRNGVVYVEVRSQSALGQDGGGSGSGFVLDDEGYILTNQHVVADADRVRVRVGNDDELVPAEVKGTDASSDLAVLKVDPETVDGGLKPLALGSSRGLEVGKPAIAIGSPFGLAGSLTTGVISALDRPIESPNGFTITGAVQTDAAINPGNSGGPLLDASGRVIGINAQIASGGNRANSGVGFAIPIDEAKRVIPALKRGDDIERPYLGVSTGDAQSGGRGAQIASVVPGAAADQAGLRTGDVIVSVDGDTVNESADVAAAIADRRPGDEVEVVLERDGDRRTERVELGKRPARVSS